MQNFIAKTSVQQAIVQKEVEELTLGVKLRDYQKEAVQRAIASECGQVILPTGSGKSIIQASIIEHHIKTKNGAGIYVVLTPRILLTNQQMRSTIRHLALDAGITNVRAITVHSGDPTTLFDDQKDSEEVLEVLKQIGIKICGGWSELHNEIIESRADNESLIICCTYQSVETLISAMSRINGDINIDQVLCDEAHYVAQRTNFENIIRLKQRSNATHFFTATRRTSKANRWNGKGVGMDNKSVYGEIICTRSIAELASRNYIVAPKLHVVRTTSNNQAKSVVECFDKHSDKINIEAGKQVNAKMLVCCAGTYPLEQIRNDQILIDYARENDVAIFAISSKCGAWKNGVEYKNKYDTELRRTVNARDQFLSDLLNHEGKAIILHISILTEGIDVPNMTGVVFFRDMTISRFSQSSGRAMRALSEDDGLEFEHRTKKFAHIIVPVNINDAEDVDKYGNVTTMVGLMRQAGMPVDDPIVGGFDIGVEVNPRLPLTNEIERRIREIIEEENAEWTHEFESDDEARLVVELADVMQNPNANPKELLKAMFG